MADNYLVQKMIDTGADVERFNFFDLYGNDTCREKYASPVDHAESAVKSFDKVNAVKFIGEIHIHDTACKKAAELLIERIIQSYQTYWQHEIMRGRTVKLVVHTDNENQIRVFKQHSGLMANHGIILQFDFSTYGKRGYRPAAAPMHQNMMGGDAPQLTAYDNMGPVAYGNMAKTNSNNRMDYANKQQQRSRAFDNAGQSSNSWYDPSTQVMRAQGVLSFSKFVNSLDELVACNNFDLEDKNEDEMRAFIIKTQTIISTIKEEANLVNAYLAEREKSFKQLDKQMTTLSRTATSIREGIASAYTALQPEEAQAIVDDAKAAEEAAAELATDSKVNGNIASGDDNIGNRMDDNFADDFNAGVGPQTLASIVSEVNGNFSTEDGTGNMAEKTETAASTTVVKRVRRKKTVEANEETSVDA